MDLPPSPSTDTPSSQSPRLSPATAALLPATDSTYLTQAIQIIGFLRDGKTVAQAGEALGISRSTAFSRLRLVEDDTERNVVKLLSAKGLDFAEDWVVASKVAAEKGDHRPAKDALLHAHAIDPVAQDDTSGTRISIIIGTPESPIRMLAPAYPDIDISTESSETGP